MSKKEREGENQKWKNREFGEEDSEVSGITIKG